jgi:hypothetical protein
MVQAANKKKTQKLNVLDLVGSLPYLRTVCSAVPHPKVVHSSHMSLDVSVFKCTSMWFCSAGHMEHWDVTQWQTVIPTGHLMLLGE